MLKLEIITGVDFKYEHYLQHQKMHTVKNI